MKRFARTAGLVFTVLFLVALGTFVAGEQTEVAVLRTVDDVGTPHDTKLWIVDHGGATWIRVGRPKRYWFQRLQSHPAVQLIRNGGAPQPMIAKPDFSPQARAEIDRAFSEKYGRVDWWYGLVLRHDPVPVRLDPNPAAS